MEPERLVHLVQLTGARRASVDRGHQQLPDRGPDPVGALEGAFGGALVGEQTFRLTGQCLGVQQAVVVEPDQGRRDIGQMLDDPTTVELQGIDEREAVLERRLMSVRRDIGHGGGRRERGRRDGGVEVGHGSLRWGDVM